MKRTSIIIPLYNNMWYVENAINSALDQIIDNDSDIEVVVVDDSSSDNSYNITHSLFKDFSNPFFPVFIPGTFISLSSSLFCKSSTLASDTYPIR